ncbi:MAG: hypothetical protein AAGC46_01950 [Solirubrobacteraceae bacterium]|nr:hypothetical protein [Patulibacter sp.]
MLAKPAKLAGQITAVVGAITLVVGLVTGGFRSLRGEHAKLVVDNTVVTNGPEVDDASGDDTQVQSTASTPTIRLTLRNAGNRSAYLRTAHVQILDSADFRTCYAQGGGDVPRSNPVSITMPVRPVAGTTVDVPLDKTLDPKARLAVPLLFGRGTATTAWSLYAIRVTFSTDAADAPLDVGRFLISVPGASSPSADAFPVVPGMHPVKGTPQQYDLAATWCYRSNLSRLQALTALPGTRAPETAELTGTHLTPGFEAHADPTPARAAARNLAARRDSSAYYAVFAAEQTHDAAFVAQIRTRATATLVALAEQQLGDPDQLNGALDDARAANQLGATAETEQLLGDAQRAWLAAHPAAARRPASGG